MSLDIRATVMAHQQTIESLLTLESAINDVVVLMKQTFADGKRIYVCGNGGSASDSQHFAAEFTGRFEADRKGFPVISLTTDTSALTSIGNDYGFDRLFARQLESLAGAGDVLFVISTSGNSGNLVEAVRQARDLEVKTVGLLGRDGGQLASMVDVPLVVPATRTARIQEAHILLLHMLCEAFEAR